MTPAEAAALLSVAAAFDNRKPDPDAAQAWALALDGIPFTDARDAIVAHYRTTSDWIMPAAIRKHVSGIRSQRIKEAGDLTPPPHAREGDEYHRWLAGARRTIGDGEPLTIDQGELKDRHLPDLRELLPRAE
jgi:hypothetical protein